MCNIKSCAVIASDTCQAAISMLAANWIELATSAFVVGVAMCGIW
jgi:hypothetical protein